MSWYCRCLRPPYKCVPRTYQKCVLVGNWYEERMYEEDVVMEYLYKREHGQLSWQKLGSLKKLCLKPALLSRSTDQYVRYGDRIMILNHYHSNIQDKVRTLCIYMPEDLLYLREYTESIIELPPKDLSVSEVVMSPTVISTFVIRGRHGAEDGMVVRYGQSFYLYSSSEKLLMMSVKKSPFFKKPLWSPNNWTAMVAECSWSCAWKAVAYDPRERMEMEGEPIKCNMRLLIRHADSNENLCLEEDYELRTPFGTDFEVTCKTKKDTTKMELPANHWVIYMDAPGKEKYPIKWEPEEGYGYTGIPPPGLTKQYPSRCDSKGSHVGGTPGSPNHPSKCPVGGKQPNKCEVESTRAIDPDKDIHQHKHHPVIADDSAGEIHHHNEHHHHHQHQHHHNDHHHHQHQHHHNDDHHHQQQHQHHHHDLETTVNPEGKIHQSEYGQENVGGPEGENKCPCQVDGGS